MTNFNPDWVSAPINTINVILIEKNDLDLIIKFYSFCLSSDKLYKMFDKYIILLANEEAEQLSKILGSTPEFWKNRFQKYQDWFMKAKNMNTIQNNKEYREIYMIYLEEHL